MTGSSTRVVRGACLCRAVTFEAGLPSKFCAHCHCQNCRRAHGAAFVTWIGFPASQVRVAEGAPLARYRTDTDATRSFCSRCGTTLFYEGPRWKDEVHVVLANLVDEPDRAPAAHVYVDHKASWWTIDDALPQYGGTTGTEKK